MEVGYRVMIMDRNTIKTALLSMGVFCALLLSGCKKDSPSAAETISGEWHLVSFEGQTPKDFDAYLALGADGTFVLWQKVQAPRWQKYAGTYTADWETIEGEYSDGTAWGCRYGYVYDNNSGRLILSSIGDVSETQEYLRQAVPEEVKESTEPVTRGSVGNCPPRLL